jgi:hypothetical protein
VTLLQNDTVLLRERRNNASIVLTEAQVNTLRDFAGHPWEIYGDPASDPANTETTLVYLLK